MSSDQQECTPISTRKLVVVVMAALFVLAGCGLRPLGQQGSVDVLMKAEGWRGDLGSSLPPFAILEIAFDRDTAEQAWAENTPEGLPDRDGAPTDPGIYGDLDEVDFDDHVVVVWSSGESGSCPGWLADIDTTRDGRVTVKRAQDGSACTDDYNPYRMMLVVDRDRVPAADLLPSERVVGIPDTPGAGGQVTTYPASP